MADDANNKPPPIYEACIYDFEKTKDALSGEGGGRPGMLGGTINGEKPIYRMLIYQAIPPPPVKEVDN